MMQVSLCPQMRDWYQPEPVAERHYLIAAVEQDTSTKPLAELIPQRLERREVRSTYRDARLDFDSGHRSVTSFEHNIDFRSGGSAEMVQRRVWVAPGQLLPEFADDEGLQHATEECPIRG